MYIGSTVDVCKRWSSTKKACLDKDSSNTGLYKHFMTGCPADNNDGKLQHLKWTLVDFMDTSEEKLTTAGHVGGPKCRCSECNRLKAIEDKWFNTVLLDIIQKKCLNLRSLKIIFETSIVSDRLPRLAETHPCFQTEPSRVCLRDVL